MRMFNYYTGYSILLYLNILDRLKKDKEAYNLDTFGETLAVKTSTLRTTLLYLSSRGLVKLLERNKKRYYFLTEKGRKVINMYQELIKITEGDENE